MAADSVGYTEGSGKKIATDTIPVFDDVSTGMPVDIEHQRVKIVTGANNASEGDVSSIHPLPVDDVMNRRIQEQAFLLAEIQLRAMMMLGETYSFSHRNADYRNR